MKEGYYITTLFAQALGYPRIVKVISVSRDGRFCGVEYPNGLMHSSHTDRLEREATTEEQEAA